MNRIHQWLCRSGLWRRLLENAVLPWVLKDVELGPDVLEIGPGPGLATDLLRLKTARVTALEFDLTLALPLAARLRGRNVVVVGGDGAAMPFAPATFSCAISCVMLHHVPSTFLQDQLLRETCRVLKPGGLLVGMDVRESLPMRLIHLGDTMVASDPSTFAARLAAAGFRDTLVEVHPQAFLFRARRPA